MPHRLSVIGTGYLGTTHAAWLASLGFSVLGLDTDRQRVTALASGELPFFEPELGALLRAGLASGRLRFTSSYADVADFADVHFLCAGTPRDAGADRAGTSALEASIDALAPRLSRPCLVVGRSTLPVGTAAVCADRLARLGVAGKEAELAWNPGFLREGHAVADARRPGWIVAGVASPRAEAILREVYERPLAEGVPLVVTDLATAELAPAAAQAFLATKISFINAMAEVCEAAGADVQVLAQALGHDPRIGAGGLQAGLGFGGGSLPADIRAFRARADDLGAGAALAFLQRVDEINDRCRARAVSLATDLAGGHLAGCRLAVLGAAFTAGSDDVRNSPAVAVAQTAVRAGAVVTVYDPAAMDRLRALYPEVACAPSAEAAIRDADLVLVLTDWPEFGEADPEVLGKAVAHRRVVDGRNVLDPARWRAAGWEYRALGRPAAPVPGRQPT